MLLIRVVLRAVDFAVDVVGRVVVAAVVVREVLLAVDEVSFPNVVADLVVLSVRRVVVDGIVVVILVVFVVSPVPTID